MVVVVLVLVVVWLAPSFISCRPVVRNISVNQCIVLQAFIVLLY